MTLHTTQQADAESDVIIIGGGPVGSYAALHLAKAGLKTKVFEEHPQIGVPSHCAGHLSIRSLSSMGLYPLPGGIVENTFRAANFYSPKGTKFSIHLTRPVTCTLNRTRFDQYLAEQAKGASALFTLNTRVQSLIIRDGVIKGVRIQRKGEEQAQVGSNLVVDAEGVSSRLLKQAGLKALNPRRLVYAVEAEVENVCDIELDAVEVYLGKAYASGFYCWLIPKLDGTAKLGLATEKGNPNNCLRTLMTKHPVASRQLAKAKINQINYHAISLGGPIEQVYTDGFMAVGDCASQVKPTTGGGVIFGLTCAKIMAETAGQALEQGDASSKALQVYQNRCSDLLNFDFAVMLRLRKFLNALTDEKVDEMLRVCGKLGVDKALSNVDEIDFQGRMIVKAAVKPSVLAALAYFALLYLITNP